MSELPLYNKNDATERIQVVIRFSNSSIQDLQLPLVKLDELSIGWLRQSVRNSIRDLSTKRLRFIHSGKVLTSTINFKEEFFKMQRFNKDNTEFDRRFYIHCLIGDELTNEELTKENEMDNNVQEQSTTPAPVGFDRLASAGFSQEDINALREQFRQLYGDLPGGGNDDDGNGDHRDIRQLEERWIDTGVNDGDEFNGVNAGSSHLGGNEDLLIGILIGCLLGVISLFLLKEEQLFSKRQRMAIVAGFIVNFSFALVRQWA